MKTVRAVFEAINNRDVDQLVPLYTDDAVVDMSEAIGPENDVYRGTEAAATWWRDSLEQWESFLWELESFTELPPDTVVTATRVDARGRASGIEMTARIGQLWRVRDGRVAYVKMFQTEEEALAAAGAGGSGSA